METVGIYGFSPEVALSIARADAFRRLEAALPEGLAEVGEKITFLAMLDRETEGVFFLGFLRLANRAAFGAMAGVDALDKLISH